MSLCQGQEKKERAQHPSLRDGAQAEADHERIHHVLHTSTIINMRHVSKVYISHERGNKSDDRMTGGQLIDQWIGLKENLQETIDFPIKYGAFL